MLSQVGNKNSYQTGVKFKKNQNLGQGSFLCLNTEGLFLSNSITSANSWEPPEIPLLKLEMV